MKLRNKKTGEIGNFCYGYTNELCVSWQKDDGFWAKHEYNSLAELNEEWEDMSEESKVFWYIECDGDIHHIRTEVCDELEINSMKLIGNYFETEEEAKKAVEKLKARTRLINHGLCLKLNKFQDRIEYKFKTGCISSEYDAEEALKDLDLLFSGEDN